MEYTNRVQLCEDGLYRWYYDLDMRKNRYMLNITFKVLGIIGAVLLAMVIFMPSGGMSKWAVAGITLGCFAVVAVLTLGIYMILLLRGNGFYRYRYMMGTEGVRLLQEERDIRRNSAMGAAASAAGIITGHTVQAAATNMSYRAAADAGYTAYSSVRKVVVDREKDCIYLKLLVGENCIYVSKEDFEFVRTYICSRLKENVVVE